MYVLICYTVEPTYNNPRYNHLLVITAIFQYSYNFPMQPIESAST